MREPTEREVLEVMDALLGFYANELKRSDDPADKLTLRQVRLQAEKACRAFLAVSTSAPQSESAARQVPPHRSGGSVAPGEVTKEMLREMFEQECKDGDRLAEALGVPRTEGGWLNVPKMLAKIKALRADGGSAKVPEDVLEAVASAVKSAREGHLQGWELGVVERRIQAIPADPSAPSNGKEER